MVLRSNFVCGMCNTKNGDWSTRKEQVEKSSLIQMVQLVSRLVLGSPVSGLDHL